MNRGQATILAGRMQREIYALLKGFEACDEQCLARFGVTASQGYALLAFPEGSTVSMNEMSQTMGLANSTMTRMVDHLVSKGLASRRPDDEDRRVVRVGLTAQGQERRRALDEARTELLREILSDVQEGEWPAILNALEKLNAAVERAMANCCG